MSRLDAVARSPNGGSSRGRRHGLRPCTKDFRSATSVLRSRRRICPMALNAPTESVARLAADEPDKDLPLRDDIRLLGRILGDTVREQEGEEVFELVEQIRQASIRFHRDNEVGARRELEATLDSLNADQTLVDRARLQLFLPSRQHRRRPASHPPQPRACDRRLGAAPGFAGLRLPAHARDGRRAQGARRVLRSRAGEPGADRPSDRGPAQEHADARTRNRRTARRARSRRRSGGARADRGEAAARDPRPLADQPPAPDAAQGDRRGRERPLILRLHVLPRAAAPLWRRSRTSSTRSVARRATRRSLPSCASAPGSAATATAIRSSPPTFSTRPCACRAPGRSAIISTNCTNLAPNCRLPPISRR